MATQHSNDFSATHQITVKHGRSKQTYFVMLDDKDSDVAGHGPAYTREEWESGSCADWERTADGWLFQGSVPHGETKVIKGSLACCVGASFEVLAMEEVV